MPTNLEWLNNMAIPVFAASLTIQISHELAHRSVAASEGMNVTFPTLVPSIVTGITSAVTSLKTPPKNKESLFDFALAGPLTGIAVSIAFLFYGLDATASMDAASYANLPALPLQFLRQSSLGGGIIDSVIPGLLNLPDAVRGSATVSGINIPLHPIAIAGYLGLLINAMNLLPVGRKFSNNGK